MKRTFLYKVYQYNRKIFWGIIIFSALTIFFNLLGDEVTPFFVWGMYSEKEKSTPDYELLRITLNDSLPVNYSCQSITSPYRRLLSPLLYYKEIGEKNADPTVLFLKQKLGHYYKWIAPLESDLFNNSKEIQNFMPWCKRYIEKSTNIKVTSITLEAVKIHYNQEQKIVSDSSYIIEKWIPSN